MHITIPALAARAPTPQVELDAVLARLETKKAEWATLAIPQKVALLRALVANTARVAQAWVTAAAQAKGIPADSPLAGEEWTSGPWALIYGANHYVRTLEDISRTGSPQLKEGSVHTRPDGQVVVDVFPQSIYDFLLLNGITAQVWMEPGVGLR